MSDEVCRKAELQAQGLFGCDCQCADCRAFYAPADALAKLVNTALDALDAAAAARKQARGR